MQVLGDSRLPQCRGRLCLIGGLCSEWRCYERPIRSRIPPFTPAGASLQHESRRQDIRAAVTIPRGHGGMFKLSCKLSWCSEGCSFATRPRANMNTRVRNAIRVYSSGGFSIHLYVRARTVDFRSHRMTRTEGKPSARQQTFRGLLNWRRTEARGPDAESLRFERG